MKRITATALFTLAALVTAGGVLAQGRAVRATVPFDFTAGDKLLPAGNYEITNPSSGVLEIQNWEKRIAIFSTATYDSHDSRGSSKLVFDKYGDQYFLREVLAEQAAINARVLPSKAEQRARMHQAALHSASQVEVAAK